jgi:colicin import membrane protein
VRLVGSEEIAALQKTVEPQAEAPKPPSAEKKPAPPKEKQEDRQVKTAPVLDKQKAKTVEAQRTPEKQKSTEASESASDRERSAEKTLDEVLARIQKKVASRGTPGAGRSGKPSGWEERQAEVLYSAYYDEDERRVRQNWIPPQNFDPRRDSLITIVSLVLLPDGRIQNSFIEQPSGSPYFDQSVMRAILKSDPFPPPPVGLTTESFELGLRFHSSPFSE